MKKRKGHRQDLEQLFEQFAIRSAKPIRVEVAVVEKIPEHVKQMAAKENKGLEAKTLNGRKPGV